MDFAQQTPLFYESTEHAIAFAITSSGKTRQQVANHLWPSMKLSTAENRLNCALNHDKKDKLSFDEIIEICKFCHTCDPLYYMCDELSHDRPLPRAPTDEAAELMRDYMKSVDQSRQIADRMERLKGVGVGQ